MSAGMMESTIAEESLSEKQEVESKPKLSESQSISVKFSKLSASNNSSHSSEEKVMMVSKTQQVTVCDEKLCEMVPEGDKRDYQSIMFEGDCESRIEDEEKNDESEVPYVDSEPPFKKNRRVQVPSSDITTGISSIEPSPKKLPKKKLHDPTPQKIGVLVGIPCRRKSSINGSSETLQLELLKHFSLIFLFSRLKNPMKWDATTFEEIRSLGESIDSSSVTTKFSVDYQERNYHLRLTSTVAKGRINSKDAPPPTFKGALIEHVSSYSGLVVKCETNYMMLWRVSDGYYLYDPCLNEVSQLIFFNSLKLLMEFVLETKQLNDRSKFYMSKISWHSVDDGMLVTLKRKSRVAKKFEILNAKEALLMGDRFFKKAGYKLESLRVSLNAIYQSEKLGARSWDAGNLNSLFDGQMNDKEINKLGVFLLEEGQEESFLLDKVRLIRLDVAFGYTEREPFELLINRFLAIRVAIILRVEEYYFAIWSSDSILYWFSPFRYDALKLDPEELEDKASFLFAFGSLDRLSTVLFEYLTEIGLLPSHKVHVFTVDGEAFGKAVRLPLVDSKDSLMRSELEINVPEGSKMKEYVQIGDLPPMTLSEAKLCRIMLREIMGGAEKRYDE
ncbi:uncharacterized protein LOC110675885 [Aedes aegypti]|uniref:Uncharacterized protein n=1 Tax=Aedes aegypti TaxID=7159 RepID=A0A6I8TU97_AEDAE|nr:uncharacterized protein LOC110675885 [Aedes aegypti]